MRVGARAEGPIEWLVDACGLVPRAMLDTFHAVVLARSVMIAAKFGVFDALEPGPKTAGELAAATSTHPQALEKVLNVLVSGGYLTFGETRYRLRGHARRWMLRSSRPSLADNVVFRYLEWEAIQNLEEFVRTGEPLEAHERMPAEYWPIYQRGMKSVAGLTVGEVVQRMALPANPRRMLDIGGSHGLYAVEFCRRYPTLEAVILELPSAIEHAAPLLAEEGMGPRVVHRAGDALSDSLGENEWDFVFTSQLVHHFTEEMNRELCRRVRWALRPGGVFAVVDLERPASPQSGGQTGTVFDLFFAATSRSGTWTAEEIQRWQADADLKTLAPLRLRWTPGVVVAPAIAAGA
jgi:SAM-dependent methyltransferase